MTPVMCGSCDAGSVPVNYCTCTLPHGKHSGACGMVPCPNGCWDRLYGIKPRPTGGLSLLVRLADAGNEVLRGDDGLVHLLGCVCCPDDPEHHISERHALDVLHLRRHSCFPQGRAA